MRPNRPRPALQISVDLSVLQWRILACTLERVLEEEKRGRPIPGAPGEFTVEDYGAVQAKLLAAFARVADEYHRTTSGAAKVKQVAGAGSVQEEDDGETRS